MQCIWVSVTDTSRQGSRQKFGEICLLGKVRVYSLYVFNKSLDLHMVVFWSRQQSRQIWSDLSTRVYSVHFCCLLVSTRNVVKGRQGRGVKVDSVYSKNCTFLLYVCLYNVDSVYFFILL